MLGVWSSRTRNEFTKETWQKINDSTFTGFAFTTVEQDTVFAETLELLKKGNHTVLKVATYTDTLATPVTFTMIAFENNKVVFENKLHDFPQRIIYSSTKKDSIHAWIEGTIGGEQQKVDLYYNKQ